MSPRQALVSSKRGVHPSERGVWKRSSEPFVFCRICNRAAAGYLMKFSLLIAWRICPKSLGSTRGVALQTASKAFLDPFRHPHNVRIRLRRLARIPFRTVTLRSSPKFTDGRGFEFQ